MWHAVELRHPLLLLTALLALPVFWLGRRAGGRLLFSSVALLPQAGRSWRQRLAFAPDLCLALGVVGLAVALAGPRVGARQSRERREGIALMMVLDRSGSMSALDLADERQERTRLDVVKEVFGQFVRGGRGLPGRPNDAIGLIAFARYADTLCPLTLDHLNLAEVARGVAIVEERGEDGTALGDGLALAVERLREATAKSRVAILLTDGVNNAGEEAPLAAAELARTQGVKVYTIGAGTNGVAPIRVKDPFSGQSQLHAMPVEIDEATLKEIAARTGGRYFRATDGEALRRIVQEIDQLERSVLTEERYREYHEHYGLFVALGLLAAALGLLGRGTIFRRLP
ncbi:MAG TPA: VWA domain-containing protein [Polyangia bacterium]|jgi:Ca-activated chloride channel family protein